jgi:hypothetical protein
MAVAGQTRTTSLEQRIRDVNKQLANEFQGRYTIEEVERIAQEALVSLQNAKVKDFVPLFVARETRDRLLAAHSTHA